MTYLPHTDADVAEMLAAVGVERVEDLFHDVPADLRFPALNLPEPLSETEIMAELSIDGPPQIREKYDRLAQFMGYADGDARNAGPLVVENEERATFAFEVYLAEGNSPTPELAGLFNDYRRWMLGIWRRTLGLYLRNPAYRRFVKQVRQQGLVPASVDEYFGYGLYVGRKPSSG